ncbi:M23 family metallopeptidase [Meiothermus taiwanensis]|jgi:murein DD-endopeptidase MepM/ murein hydrolase activator NlpD|uniref:L-Ala--D-Glu endopeptidase n=2 Tax=Meiothermus taiwanensis TaxID=172827 RepID=A0A399DYN9_9DEIN|nr:M23 family metallopeptidase [Meiothermus taiwanensis]AWR85365.1 peptidase M23 [Meiothermus taiwanensis WR-220]KIQ55256.1 peptidase M23 [Meiothermus taiwanensis]KZK16543.1 peptidase M23 [Meiothermus taiwanensis]RIH76589.1 L-Ala--D-Glu endopeptidase [Meiothermus taiwanensis]
MLARQVGFSALLCVLLWGSEGLAQRGEPDPEPGRVCNSSWSPPEPRTEAERRERERWAAYRAKLQSYLALLPKEPDTRLAMPVQGVRVRQVTNTFGAPRSGWRTHEGQDIFAPRGTPVYSATRGFVWRIGQGQLGGLYVFVVGPGGRRYYYAHLDRYAPGLQEGQRVTPQTLLGYVGNTGNARTTPPHLHFGVYAGSRRTCDYRVIDPLPLLTDRDWKSFLSPARNP